MATWNLLKCEEADFEPFVQILKGGIAKEKFSPATTVVDIFLDKAKSDMRIDLQMALDLNPQDADDNQELDRIVADQYDILKRALSYKQLHLALLKLSRNMDSIMFHNAMEQKSNYEEAKSVFPGLKSRGGDANVKSIQVF